MDTLPLVFKALADTNRIRIINLLLHGGELCVCEFEGLLDLPQSLVSRHLTVLKHAGLVRARRREQWMFYALVDGATLLEALHVFLAQAFREDAALKNDLRLLQRKSARGCGEEGRKEKGDRRKEKEERS